MSDEPALRGWCECGHHESWHRDGERCTYLESRFDHATQTNIDVPCECFSLDLAYVEIG